MSYIIQYRENNMKNWARSSNISKTNQEKNLGTFEFTNHAEAEEEARKQQNAMGGAFEYRAFRKPTKEEDVIAMIKAVLDAPAPKTKLEQIKAILEEI
jgi:hypothetical protein